MDESKIMLRGYMSHAIRGRKGSDCPPLEVEGNCLKATQDGTQLMALFQRWGLPVLLYIPGSRDEFIQKAYKAGRITETEILDTDCDIIADCDFLLQYDWQNYISGGMKYESDYSEKNNIPIYVVRKFDQRTLWDLQGWLCELLLNKMDEPTIISISGNVNGS